MGLLLLAGCGASGSGPSTNTDGAGNGGTASSAGSGGAGGAGSGNSAGKSSGGNGALGGMAGAEASGGSAGVDGGVAGMGGDGGSGGGKALGRPNVVVVLLDDMGYSDLGAYGGEIRTPTIDSLADTGTRFRNFHVTPRCSPTRISLLTGLYTQQGAVTPGASLPPLRTDNNVTLPEMLSSAGYRTYMAGKWHIGTGAEQTPRARGFDHVFGIGQNAAGAEANKWDKAAYSLHSKGNAIAPRTYGDGPRAFYQADAMADYALDYLTYHYAQNDDAPFFMYMAYNSPHFPVQADKALVDNAPAGGGMSYAEMYAAGWNTLREQRYQRMLQNGVIDDTFGLTPAEPFMSPTQQLPLWATLAGAQQADLVRKMGLYAASIQSVDTSVGRVVARLKELDQFDNTLIFVLSDNGGNYEGGPVGSTFGKNAALTGDQLANMGQPGQDDHMQVGGGWANVHTTPFRFYKHYTHGGGVRSPLVVSWPARTFMPGAWSNQFAHVIDLAPTILAAAEVQQPTQFAGHDVLPLEGTSLVGTIDNGNAPVNRQIGFEHETNRAWVDGKFKLVVRHENDDKVELYNLETDPTELNDLAAGMPAKRKSMVEAWNTWAKHVGVPAERLLPEG